MKIPIRRPKISSADVLEALGLERRRSSARKLINGIGIATVGALMGASAVVVGTMVLGGEHKTAAQRDEARRRGGLRDDTLGH